MPDFNALASWLQDRYTEAETHARAAAEDSPTPWTAVNHLGEWTVRDAHGYGVAIASQVYPECVIPLTEPEARHIANHEPAAVLADLASKRALLADLMAEGHIPDCFMAMGIPVRCTCYRDARLLRRLRILASPYAGRDDMPAELREAS